MTDVTNRRRHISKAGRGARRAVGVFLVLACVSARALAQEAVGGSVSGYVKGAEGIPLPGVVVTATSPSLPGSRLTTTDKYGYYTVTALSPADYAITADLSNVATVVRENVVVREGLDLRLDFVMPIGTTYAAVTVTSDTPMLESKKPAQTINIAGELQRAIPLSSRRTWSDFLQLAPGVTMRQGRFETYSLYGTTPASGAFFVDGADVTSVLQGSTLYAQFGSDTIADIQVTTAGRDAAAPLGLGPIVNIASQSASDRLRVTSSVSYQPMSWNHRNTVDGTDAAIRTLQVDGSLSGPLIPGRWWFFGSGRLANNRTGNPRSAQQVDYLRTLAPGFRAFDNPWEGQFGFAKINGLLTTKHQVTATYSRDVLTLGGAQPNEAAPFRDVMLGGPAYFARVSSVWRASLIGSVSVGYNGRKQVTRNRLPELTGVNVHESVFESGGRLLGAGVVAVLVASPSPATDFDVHMWTISADVTVHTQWRGSHELRAGTYLQPNRADRRITQYNHGGFQLEEVKLRDPRDPSAGVIPFHRQVYDADRLTTMDVDSRDYALYVQDAWRATSRLTVNGGVRVDIVRRLDRLFDAVAQDSIEVGPRIGATLMLTGDLRNTLRWRWGRSHENLSLNPTQVGTNVAGVRDLYDTAMDGAFAAVFATPPRTARSSNVIIDLDGYHQEHVDEMFAGYNRQLPGQAAVDVTILRRAYRNRPAMVESNGIYADGVFAGYRDPSQNEIYRLTANTWNWPVTTALQIAASKSTRRIKAIAGYTRGWAHLTGTWQPNDPTSFIQPEAFRNEGGIGFVNGCTTDNPACPDNNSLSAGFGGGPWVTHVGHVGIVYETPWRMHLASAYTFQSGPWSGPIQTKLDAPDPRFGPPTVTLENGRIVSNPLATLVRFAYPTRAEGQFRLPNLHVWNVRVARTFARRGVRLEAALDVLNVTNRGADQVLQPGANQQFSPFFGRGGAHQFPRAFLVSARLSM